MLRNEDAHDPFIRQEEQSDEEYVRTHFWSKLKSHTGKIPFLKDAIATYYAAVDPATPKWAKAVAFSGLAYFILPVDLIPDFLVVVGWTDDAAILAGALKTLSSKVTDNHREMAEVWIHGRKRTEK
ncbi:YkvA family protein [Gorillibacterium massiliense]|uniref:YkvA family protein n=1 Tax=Gorillibacterium massiliense TaxID=1280390 RepID=UPI0004B4F47D|nr:YkvA family protein [Gorillibacterium massiliense]